MNDKAEILGRIKDYFGFNTDTDLADFLGIKRSTLSNWTKRNSIDYDLVLSKCEHIDKNWLLCGIKTKTTKNKENVLPASTQDADFKREDTKKTTSIQENSICSECVRKDEQIEKLEEKLEKAHKEIGRLELLLEQNRVAYKQTAS